MKPEDCICYKCGEFNGVMAGELEFADCACDSGPVYNVQACGTCQFKDRCDVAQHPQNYPLHTDDKLPE